MVGPLRVFLSHTSELREFPESHSFVTAAESAINRNQDAPVDMKYFTADDNPTADVCRSEVRRCDVYVGIIGLRYGTPVKDEPTVSYTELEFNEATEARLKRIVFLLDDTQVLPIPANRLFDQDPELLARQRTFRQRLESPDLTILRVATPADLEIALLQALQKVHSADLATLPSALPREPFVPEKNPRFAGRRGTLARIAQYFQAGSKVVVAIHGLGGVGKTQVALEYFYQSQHAARYQVMGWIRAESPEKIAEDIAALAPQLGLAHKERSDELAKSVLKVLASARDWMLVFDNAEDQAALKKWLPNGSGHVLITSRLSNWRAITEHVLDLHAFKRAESIDFLCDRTGDANRQAASQLAAELGDLPLALAQAAAFMDTVKMGIADYLDMYQDPEKARELRDEGLQSEEYGASVAKTWLLNFSKLQQASSAAVDLLRLCSFLDADDIDLEVLAGAAQSDPTLAVMLADRLQRLKVTGSLLEISFAQPIEPARIQVHRLVQAVTRDQLDPEELAAWVARAVTLLAAVFPDPNDAQSWQLCARLAPHVEAVTSYVDGYPDLAAVSGKLLNNVAIYFQESAQFTAARASLTRALSLQEQALGTDHVEVAKTLGNLSSLLDELDKPAEAEDCLKRALAIFETTYGPDHALVGSVLGNLGILRSKAGQLEDAREALERAVSIKEASLNNDSTRTAKTQIARTLSNLGNVYRKLERLSDAMATQQRALAITEAAGGTDTPEAANYRTNLAEVQRDLGELPEALANLEWALRIAKAAHGPDNPDNSQVANILVQLGRVQRLLKDSQAARNSFTGAVAIFEKVYEPGHRDLSRAKLLLSEIPEKPEG
jgi:tetratricopeptide (TPR) repeat protein